MIAPNPRMQKGGGVSKIRAFLLYMHLIKQRLLTNQLRWLQFLILIHTSTPLMPRAFDLAATYSIPDLIWKFNFTS